MKAVMISIRPEWCEKILSGEKTVEVRRTRPKLKTPFKCYIYCSKNLIGAHIGVYASMEEARTAYSCGKVVAEFTCDFIYNDYGHCNGQEVLDSDLPGTAMTVDQYNKYCSGSVGFGWHISGLQIYDKPKELSGFYRHGAESLEELAECENLCNFCYETDCGEHRFSQTPNGYWSCEGRWCEEAYQEYLDQNFMLQRPPQSWCYVEELEVEK